MSVPVSLDSLRGEVADFGSEAYVLTVGGDGRPHAVLVSVEWEGERLLARVGSTTARNAAGNAQVSLLWSRREPGGYSLIVDGAAELDGEHHLRLAPAKAVLHRAAAGDTPASEGACGSDCVPLLKR